MSTIAQRRLIYLLSKAVLDAERGLTEAGIARALAAKGLTDVEARAAIASAASLVAGMRAIGLLPAATPAPTPAPGLPVFSQQPRIDGTPRIGQTLTVSSVVSNGSVVSRRWLLGASLVSIAQSYLAEAVGSLVCEETAQGPGGTTVATSAPVTVVGAAPAPTPTPPPSLGEGAIGHGYASANYYAPFSPLNDWGKFVDIRNDDLDPDPDVFVPDPNNGTVVVPFASINGYANVQTSTGATLTAEHATLAVVSSNPTTGQHRIRVIADAADTNARQFRWAGSKPTHFTVARDGASAKIAAEWIAGVEGPWLRNLDMDFANGVPITGQYVTNEPTDAHYRHWGSFGAYLPMQDQCDAIAAWRAANPGKPLNLWDVIPADRSDAQLVQRATIQRDTLPTDTEIALEFGNEQIWNKDFSGVNRTLLDAARKGWYGAATPGNPQPGIDGPYLGYVGGVNTASPATPAGSRVFVSLGGVGLITLKARRNVAAGAPLGAGEDWAVELGQDDMHLAGRRYRSVRHDQIIEIYRSVFGEARFQAQVVPVVMGQLAVGNVVGQLVTERTFDPAYWAKVKGTGYAFYFDDAETVAGPGTTPAMLAAAIRDAGFPKVKDQVVQAIVDARTLGKRPMFYEGGTHASAPYYDPDVPYKTSWTALFNSEAGADILRDIAIFMRQYLPANGVACFYNMTGDDQRYFSLRKSWSDTANRRYTGWKAGLAAALPAPATTGWRYIRLSPLGGNRQGLQPDNAFYRVGWSGLAFRGGAAAIVPGPGALTSSTSTSGANRPRLLLDGDTATGFLTEQGSFDRTGVVVFDAGPGASIDPTEIRIIEGGAGREGFTPVGMKVEGSLDGVTWTLLATKNVMAFTGGVAPIVLDQGGSAAPSGYSRFRITPALAFGSKAPSDPSYRYAANEVDFYLADGSVMSKAGWTASNTDGSAFSVNPPAHLLDGDYDSVYAQDDGQSPRSGQFVIDFGSVSARPARIRITDCRVALFLSGQSYLIEGQKTGSSSWETLRQPSDNHYNAYNGVGYNDLVLNYPG